jgi:ubiquinone/menaquinone biosynthesis C-methylase UbiE
MKAVESYYGKKSGNYEVFCTLYFRVYDAVTWKYLEPYVPTSPNAVVLDAVGGTGRWATRMARERLQGCFDGF